MTASSLDIIAMLVAFAAIVSFLYQDIRNTRIRIEHLRMAIRASNHFYDRAEILLHDPKTPDALKQMVLDIGLAVTDEQAGRQAVAQILKSAAEMQHRGRTTPPKKELVELLDDLRKTRGDLYDAFNEALSSAFAAILAAYGSSVKSSKFALNYDATSNRLSVAESLDHAIADWRLQRSGNVHQMACA